ncbi:MAG TPA: polymer-forming cytoskeletal protein [Polyangiaceae bacterium LLY-WYZ-14_1]|nr:polymer-forming cytoskeletal protein [Polyangiaceae bacterium LLY-WYZ-14_1]
MAHRDSGGYIGSDLMVQGRLSGKASLAVDGLLGGDVRLDGTLEIGPGGRMVARCQVGGLVVRGEVVGEIEGATSFVIRKGFRNSDSSE